MIERGIVENPDKLNKNLLNRMVDALKKHFPIDTGKYVIELQDVSVPEKIRFTPQEVKEAVLKKTTLGVPVKGTLVVKDKETGKIIQKDKRMLLRAPLFTDHYSFIVDGTEYTLPNQLRIRPGVYTRFRANKDPEASFNLAQGKNFDIVMDPKTSIYNIEFRGGGKVPLYPILEALGVSKEEIAKKLGKNIAEANASAFSEKEKQNAVNKFLEITGSSSVKEFFDNTKIDPNVTELTLGKRHEKVTPETLLAASHKLLRLTKGEVEPDNRDKLAFKQLLTPEDILAEAIEKRSKPIINKMKHKVNQKGEIPDGINFNKSVHQFLATAQLSQNPEQINPVEFIDRLSKVTYLGEGGISSTQAVPLESRNVQDSYLGFIDLIRTSESQKAGMDLRVTIGAHKGKDGYIYAPFFNVKTKKLEYLNPLDVEKHVVATPEYFENKSAKEVAALKNGKLTKVKRSEVEYVLPHGSLMFSHVTGALPFLNNNSGNRVNMASKFLTQALSLEHREEPLVQTGIGNDLELTYQKNVLPSLVEPVSPVDGVVTAIAHDHITIKDKKGKKHIVNLYRNYPLSRKTMLDQTPIVKVGDKVSAKQRIAESNYSKGESIALGTHLNAVYIPYKGKNHEDGIVISESAAKKLTSLHMYKHFHEITPNHKLSKKDFKAQYPTEFTQEQLDKLDDDGVVKPGTKLKKGDPLIAALVKREPTKEELLLGKLSKSFLKPMKKYTETWDKDVEAEVVDVKKHGKKIMITIKTKEPAVVGDKLAIQHGGKGVITEILPDEKMPQVNGKPADIILTPLGILSRTNPGQIYELIHNKIAQKLGKPIVVNNFSGEDIWKKTQELMKKHNVSDTEEVVFPENGKKVKALAGPLYTLKLFKQTETNYAARDFGEYDSDERPIKGGEEGAKSVGMLDMYAYISHGAKHNLKEIAAYKGTKNDDFWNAIMLGKPIPAPKPAFVTEKFLNMLRAGGVNVVQEKDGLRLLPMTDKEVLRLSNGEIKEPNKIDYKMNPEKGGIFDPTVLGGLNGDRWGHIKLPTKIVNPVFEKQVQILLGKDAKMYGDETYNKLKAIDVDKELEATKKELEKAKTVQERDRLRKKLKVLFNLKKQGFKNPAEAYMKQHIPVIPPKYRPLIVGKDNIVLSHDANYLYTDLLLHKKGIEEAKKEGIPDEALDDVYTDLYKNVKALYGLADPSNPELRAKNVQGFIAKVTGKGKQPKESYFQAKVIKRTQDLSGRATAVTDASLGIDEIGIPLDMGLTIYKPFIVKELTRQGYKLSQALEMIDNKDPKAIEALHHVAKDRPVIANRAPTLWKHNIMAFKPKFVEGKSIVANGLVLPGFNLDFDGDTLQVYVPATEEAKREALEKMMPSKIPFNIQKRDIQFYPRQEALMGLYKATKKNG